MTFSKSILKKKHYLKLNYNYDVPDIEASSRLDTAIAEWQERWFKDLYENELAISYCSEDTAVVGPIVNFLHGKVDKIFYDVDKRGELVGDNLERKLPHIYGEASR